MIVIFTVTFKLDDQIEKMIGKITANKVENQEKMNRVEKSEIL